MAWKNREGGDRNHGNGVHFEKNARTKAIKAFVKDRLTPDLKLFLRGPDLFAGDLLDKATTAHSQALATLAQMHALPVQDAAERARIYRERFLESPAWRSLKAAMDLWCACWFWPAEEIGHAPLPTNFADPPPETRARGRTDRGADALPSLGAGVPGRVPGAGLGVRCDPRQSAVGHRQARLQGVLLRHRPPLPLLRQAGSVAEAVGVLRGPRGGARLGWTTTPVSAPSRTS